MGSKLSEEGIRFRDEVRRFMRESLPEDIRRAVLARQHLGKPEIVRWQRILNARGWAVPAWPKEWGGTGWTPLQRYIFMSEMAAAGAPEPLSFNTNMVGPVIAAFGTEEQKRRFLPPTANLDIWWCQGFSEPGAGSDLASLKTTARREGDYYVVDGQKIWTTQAQHADWMFALVRTDPSAVKQRGISFLLIDMRTPGITVRPIQTIDGACDANEVFFDQVRVPVGNRVGEENRGWDCAKYLLGHERTGIARIGSSKERITFVQHLAERQAGRDGRPLMQDEGFRRRLTALQVELRALEVMQLRLLAATQLGAEPVAQHGDVAAHGAAASLLKIKGSELQQALTELMLEVAGPTGLVQAGTHGDMEQEEAWRPAAAAHYLSMRKVSIFGGSNEIQKNIIAKTLLGL